MRVKNECNATFGRFCTFAAIFGRCFGCLIKKLRLTIIKIRRAEFSTFSIKMSRFRHARALEFGQSKSRHCHTNLPRIRLAGLEGAGLTKPRHFPSKCRDFVKSRVFFQCCVFFRILLCRFCYFCRCCWFFRFLIKNRLKKRSK
jgi:hypothetical protein